MEENTKTFLIAIAIVIFLVWLFGGKTQRWWRRRVAVPKRVRTDIRNAYRCKSRPPHGLKNAYCEKGQWLYSCADVEHDPNAVCNPQNGQWETPSGCLDADGVTDQVCVETEHGSKWIDMITIPNDTGTDGVLTPQYNTPLVLNA